ncbi:amidohydrolase family protein [Williamsia sterculiae]|uniref:Imidazolonepropionase n=1 Tax=Williamsia sterculiae TaxID=1344003 RepID=A0A1N7FKX0_9NOCA|nr:amidohydrolase family protein [Williamsia sterculiae]SIS00963.1 Imidazolonepropionase [Williamsia sterculiae]
MRIVNARLFINNKLTRPSTLTVAHGLIDRVGDGHDDDSSSTTATETIDAAGGTLLPGLIDAHLHLSRPEDLHRLATHGVTTAFDMASWPPEFTNSLRGRPRTTQIISAGVPFIGPDGPHSHFVTADHAIVTDVDQVPEQVTRRLDDGSDFIKVVLEAPGGGGPSPAVAAAVVTAAHRAGRRVVAHAANIGAFRLAVECGADVVTHVPRDQAVDPTITRCLADTGRVAIPTLGVSEILSDDAAGYDRSRASVRALREAGVPILAGTDAVESSGVPFAIPLGTSLHHELELLTDAEWTPLDAIASATALPARHFGLEDRGEIKAGRRADLVLIDGDPSADITMTRHIVGVWIAGERVA